MRWHVVCGTLTLTLALAVGANNGSFAPSPLSLGSNWDVPCGDSGLCSDGNPICCGSSYPFCISGGQRCCSGRYPGQVEGSISSCGMDQECCVGGRDQMYTVSCCNRTQSCQEGQCVEDVCSNTTNADFCLSHPACEWCCSTNRCQRQGVGASCNGGLVRRTYHERCSDNCSSIAVCSDCVKTFDEFGDGCTWCAQTQSCMNSININQCSNDQYASNALQCADIGPTGRGLSHVEQQHSDLGPIILATLAITVFLVFALSVIRIILHRRRLRAFLQMVEVGEATSASDVHQRGHGAIVRFGFQTAAGKLSPDKESKASEPATPSPREMSEKPKQEIKLIGPDAIRCPLCGSGVQLPNPSYCPPPVTAPSATDDESHEGAPAEGGDGAPAARGEGKTEETVNSLEVMRDEVEASDASPTTRTQEEGPRERTEHQAEQSPASSQVLAKLVLMLPCYHVACVSCAKRAIESGIGKANAAEEKKGSNTAASARGTEDKLTGIGPRQTESAAVSSEAKKSREESDNHTECPHCRQIVECLLIPSRIIRN